MSTQYETVAASIRTRFQTEVAIKEEPSLEVQYDNEVDVRADDKVTCRLRLNFGERTQMEICGNGTHKFRLVGIMVASLFGPANEGDKDLLELAGKVLTAFQAVTADGVTYRTPQIVNVGTTGNVWQVNVNCPFYADSIE